MKHFRDVRENFGIRTLSQKQAINLQFRLLRALIIQILPIRLV